MFGRKLYDIYFVVVPTQPVPGDDTMRISAAGGSGSSDGCFGRLSRHSGIILHDARGKLSYKCL